MLWSRGAAGPVCGACGGRRSPGLCRAYAGAAAWAVCNRCGCGAPVQRMQVRLRGSAGGGPRADGSAWLYQTPWPEPRSLNLYEFMEWHSINLTKFVEWGAIVLVPHWIQIDYSVTTVS